MKNQKKVMILGAGEGQLPFINICRKKGYYVIVVSIPGQYPGFKIADKSYYIDTRDKDAILQVAEKEKIDAILTDQTDVSVPTVAYVSEKLGLRGIGYDTSLLFTNKYEMRKIAKSAGVHVPEFRLAKNIEEARVFALEIGFPLMIKPVDSSGSRGVTKISSIEELNEHFYLSQKYSTDETVLLEQFIKGKEYLVDGFAMDNKYINLDLGVKEYFNVPNIFVSRMCMFSSVARVNDEVGKKVLEANMKLVNYIGLEFGITHAEYLYNEDDGNVYLVEIAARGGGVFLSSDITPSATGVNTNEMLIDYVVEGNKSDISKIKIDDKVSSWLCFSLPKGRILEINGVEDVKKIDGVHKVVLDDIYIGKEVENLTDDSNKYGPFLINADTEEESYEIINKIKERFDVRVQTEHGIKNLIW